MFKKKQIFQSEYSSLFKYASQDITLEINSNFVEIR